MVAAFSIICNTCNLMLSATFFSAAAITVLTGVALLCQRSGTGKWVLVSGIVNAALVIVCILAMATIYLFPEQLTALYSSDAEVIGAVKQILYQETVMLPFLMVLLLRAGLCLLLAAGEIIAYFCMRRATQWDGRADRGTAAMMLAVPLLALFNLVKNTCMTLWIGHLEGSSSLTAYSTASSALPGGVLAFLFIAVTAWALCSVKWKPWLRVLPPIGMVLTVLVISCICNWESLSVFLYFDWGETLKQTYIAASLLYFGAAVMLVGYIFWASAAAEGAILCWVQLIACVAVAANYLLYAPIMIIGRMPLLVASLFTAGIMIILAVASSLHHARKS